VRAVAPRRPESATDPEVGEPLTDALSTDSQLWIDLGASLRITREIELYAQLHNTLDAQDIVSRRPLGARPNAPRWLHAGAKLRL
jgi:Fe(3+) dicitrate transport protein